MKPTYEQIIGAGDDPIITSERVEVPDGYIFSAIGRDGPCISRICYGHIEEKFNLPGQWRIMAHSIGDVESVECDGGCVGTGKNM